IMADGEVVREGSPQEIVLDPANDFVAAFTRDVDRARLFDVRFAMGPVDAIATDVFAEPGGPGFVVDAQACVIGVLSSRDVRRVLDGASASAMMTRDFSTIDASTTLLDAARAYRADRPTAVTDDAGRLIGTLCAEKILAGISAAPAPVLKGASHA